MQNPKLASYVFLEHMLADSHFPQTLVRKGVTILHELCDAIELHSPCDVGTLYTLTHAATERFNDLAEELWDVGSEIETVARENIGEDIAVIAKAYGFPDADPERLIAPRDW